MAFAANSLVKITGIASKPELNEQVAKVISQTTGGDGMPRYMLELQSSGARISLKPGNLLPVAGSDEGGGGGGFGGMPAGMPDMQGIMNALPPWLKEKLARGQTPDVNDAKRLLGIEDVPTNFFYALAGLFVVLFLKASLLKALVTTGFMGFVLVTSGPAFQRAGGGAAGAKASAAAASDGVRRVVLGRAGYDLTESQGMLVLGACAVGLVAWIAQPFFSGASAAAATGYGGGGGGGYAAGDDDDDDFFESSSTTTNTASITKQLQSAYDRGYDDGLGGAARQTMEEYKPESSPPPPKTWRPFKPMAPMSPPPSSSSGLFGNMGIGGIIQIGFLCKNIYSLGGQPFNPMNIVPNFMMQSNMQKFFMALMVARLFGMSPI